MEMFVRKGEMRFLFCGREVSYLERSKKPTEQTVKTDIFWVPYLFEVRLERDRMKNKQ